MNEKELVERILKYLKEEYGINSKEEFIEIYKNFKGLDVSIFVDNFKEVGQERAF